MYSEVFGFEGLVVMLFSNMALRESREVALVLVSTWYCSYLL